MLINRPLKRKFLVNKPHLGKLKNRKLRKSCFKKKVASKCVNTMLVLRKSV